MKYTKSFLLVISAISMLAISCSPTEEKRNTEIATQMFAAFNAHDWQKMNSFYSSDADYLDPAFGIEYVKKSPEEIIKKYSEMQLMFPNIHDEIKGMYASADKVTVEFISTGSSGDSIQFALPICAILTFSDGKITRDASYYDNQ